MAFDKVAMEWKLIQTRTISGKGVLKIPAEEKKIRAYILYANVIREPRNKYLNKNWNPDKSKYAFLTFLYQNYVLDTASVEFDGQMYAGVNDISGQTLIAVKCAYAGLLESVFKLSSLVIASNAALLASGVEPISITDLIKDYENLRLSWDEIRIKCYADTALQFKLYSLKYGACDPEKDKDKPPPPPPPPPPKVPPGTPYTGIDNPYDNTNNDNGNTEPYKDDKPPEPPGIGEPCSVVTVNVTYQALNAIGDFVENRTAHFIAFAPVWGVRSTDIGGARRIEIECRGNRNQGAECLARNWYGFTQGDIGNIVSYTVT